MQRKGRTGHVSTHMKFQFKRRAKPTRNPIHKKLPEKAFRFQGKKKKIQSLPAAALEADGHSRGVLVVNVVLSDNAKAARKEREQRGGHLGLGCESERDREKMEKKNV